MTSLPDDNTLLLALAGDVMTGRGVDQVLPHPSEPTLHEECVKNAHEYVALAERKNGPIPAPVDFDYLWGEALAELKSRRPDGLIVNLETAITTNDAAEPRKEIHYRMHPGNVGCLLAAGIDCCVLSNNHVLDWGVIGLEETLAVLRAHRIATAGAGRNSDEASRPAILDRGARGRIAVLGLGMESAGVPSEWAATPTRTGVQFLKNLSSGSVQEIRADVTAFKRPRDIVVASIHWGPNWGYEIPEEQSRFARALIEEAGVDLVHGHSSHHPKLIEFHKGKLILHGCGDLINDYEGISGQESFHGEIGFLYFVRISTEDGRIASLETPGFRMDRFRLRRVSGPFFSTMSEN